MAERPDGIVLTRHRDLQGIGHRIWARRIGLLVVGAIILAGLFNLFGQRPETVGAQAPRATLHLYAPERVRSGLLFMARFTIHANEDVKNAALLLSPGWAESITINTIEPGPISEGSRNGDLLFTLGHIPKGQNHVLFMEFQANPTNVGRRVQDVALYDGATRLLTIHRTITVFP